MNGFRHQLPKAPANDVDVEAGTFPPAPLKQDHNRRVLSFFLFFVLVCLFFFVSVSGLPAVTHFPFIWRDSYVAPHGVVTRPAPVNTFQRSLLSTAIQPPRAQHISNIWGQRGFLCRSKRSS